MALISEKTHNEKLKKYGINIITKYIVGNQILQRSTNKENNSDIVNGIRCEKEYFKDREKIHVEKVFDSRIEYTYVFKEEENKEYTCKNCGMHSKLKDFVDGCPYCKSYYNIDYTDKELGSKYHYDMVLKSNLYRVVTLVIDLILSLILSYIFIKNTSRTFNSIDVIKVVIYALILSLVLYYAFYLLDAYLILPVIKRYKTKRNNEQIEFWNRTGIDKKSFYNNFNYEIRNYYFSFDNIIDYDILDYTSFSDIYIGGEMFADVGIDIRLVEYENSEIKSKICNDVFRLKKNSNKVITIKKGQNMIRCGNCGATVDLTKKKCDYCNTKVSYFQNWIMDRKIK